MLLLQIVKCENHNLEFKLPTTEKEFVSGSLHDEVERCQSHLLEFDCVLGDSDGI